MDERPLPDLAHTYQLYDDDKLEEFIDAATELLEDSADLNRHHTILLLTFIANSVESDEDTVAYLARAEREYQLALLYQEPGDAAALEEVGAKLAEVRTLVEDANAAPARPSFLATFSGAADDDDDAVLGDVDDSSAVGEADESAMASRAPEAALGNAGPEPEKAPLTMRVSPFGHCFSSFISASITWQPEISKSLGSMKLRSGLKPRASKAELRQLSGLFDKGDDGERSTQFE